MKNRTIGAHLSIAGSYNNPLQEIVRIGGNCLQIFSSSPRGWNNAYIEDEKINQFVKLRQELSIRSIYFHACYLINLADEGETGAKSKQSLIHELHLAEKMGVVGSVVHTGSFKQKKTEPDLFDQAEYVKPEKYGVVIENLKEVLGRVPAGVKLILENAGTRKIGQSIEELAAILTDVNDERVRICLDTCHLHAAGYNLVDQDSFAAFLAKFDQLIGLKKLELVHFNDSRDPFGSLRDRHENIGQGLVGVAVFKNFLNHPQTKHLPFIIETPGFDGKGPDRKNIEILLGYIV